MLGVQPVPGWVSNLHEAGAGLLDLLSPFIYVFGGAEPEVLSMTRKKGYN